MSTKEPPPSDEPLLTSGILASLLETDQRLLNVWVDRGLIPFVRQLGGQRRYRASDVEKAYAARDAELPATFKRYLAGENVPPVPLFVIKRIPTDQLRSELARREKVLESRRSTKPRAETRGAE